VPVSSELLSALAAYLPQPLVRLLRDDPYRDWVGYARQQPAAVLFADLVGFTPMTELLTAQGREGAEELTRILDQVFTLLIATCEEFGGVVGKFAGDALAVYWAVDSDSDLPAASRSALACGLTLQSQMEAFARVPTTVGSFRLAMRVGVAAGVVELRVVGDPTVGLEALVLGWPLHAASQAQQVAQPGQVVAHPSVSAEAGSSSATRPNRNTQRGQRSASSASEASSAPHSRQVPSGVVPDITSNCCLLCSPRAALGRRRVPHPQVEIPQFDPSRYEVRMKFDLFLHLYDCTFIITECRVGNADVIVQAQEHRVEALCLLKSL